MADNGTVFLDEIGDMPMEMQVKLLRFLQSGEIRAVGDVTTKKVQVRVIAATNRKLEEAIERGEFRADLFYRLNAFAIHLPPLRERKEDIPLLAYHFLKSAQAKVNKRVTRILPAALADYNWPGNLRELENVIERVVVLTNTDEIDVAHLPLTLQPHLAVSPIGKLALRDGLMELKATMIDRLEHQAVCRYLAENGGNVSRAAQAAKVPRRTLQRLMAKHKIAPQVFKENGLPSDPISSSTVHNNSDERRFVRSRRKALYLAGICDTNVAICCDRHVTHEFFLADKYSPHCRLIRRMLCELEPPLLIK